MEMEDGENVQASSETSSSFSHRRSTGVLITDAVSFGESVPRLVSDNIVKVVRGVRESEQKKGMIRKILPKIKPVALDVKESRRVRGNLWRMYGEPMHFLTLEFKEWDLELKYATHLARQNKWMVQTGVACRTLLGLAMVVSRLLAPAAKFDFWVAWIFLPSVTTLLFFFQWLQMKFCSTFVQRKYHNVLLFWSFVQIANLVLFRWVLEPAALDRSCLQMVNSHEEMRMVRENLEGTMQAIGIYLLLAMFVLNMYFQHLVYLVLFAMAGYMLPFLHKVSKYPQGSMCSHWEPYEHLAILCIIVLFMGYMLEYTSRKDFIQSLMLESERTRSDALLKNVLPTVMIQRLQELDGTQSGQRFECVTVLFADVVSFTVMSSKISATALVELLNEMFIRLDLLAAEAGIEKIKTVGDCYMAAAGLPEVTTDHAKVMARFGLDLLEIMASGAIRNPVTSEPVQMRVGLHSGPCVAGVIGHKKFAYDVWGDAVNTASRMESHGEAMRLHCTADSYQLLKRDFDCEARDPAVEVKGKGKMQTYFVLRELGQHETRTFRFSRSMPPILLRQKTVSSLISRQQTKPAQLSPWTPRRSLPVVTSIRSRDHGLYSVEDGIELGEIRDH